MMQVLEDVDIDMTKLNPNNIFHTDNQISTKKYWINIKKLKYSYL